MNPGVSANEPKHECETLLTLQFLIWCHKHWIIFKALQVRWRTTEDSAAGFVFAYLIFMLILMLCTYVLTMPFFQLFWKSSKTNVLNTTLFVPDSETWENLIFSNKSYSIQDAYKNETAVLYSSKLNKGCWKLFAFNGNQCLFFSKLFFIIFTWV